MLRRREFVGWGVMALGSLPRLARAADALASHVAMPQDFATPTEYFDREITPTRVFFVRSHFGPPALRPGRRLRIDGLVERPLDLGVADLRHFEEVTTTCVLQCAGNGRSLAAPRVPGVQWTHGAMGQATWTGVRLADVLKKAGVKNGAAHVHLLGADWPPKPTVPRYLRGFPLERALDPTTLVAYRMNGEPLTLAHGAPLRLVVPGWTGNHWIKWLTQVSVQDKEAEGFYMQTAYRLPKQPVPPGTAVKPADTQPVTTFPIKSIIARPAEGSTARVGAQEIAGVAFSGTAAIARVEVSLDEGMQWSAATLEGTGGPGRWQVFRHRFDANKPGPYRAVARATDKSGVVQPAEAQWNPSGYLWNGCHAVNWTVAS
jgi:DMSO/TMAO reductase YedYZ molybdopterin-dependent catalytic subunit